MTRSLLAALVVLLFAVPASAQQGDDAAVTEVATRVDADATTRDDDYAEDEGLDEEDYDDEEDYGDEDVEFCGGGEETIVDMAYYELEADHPAEASRMMIEALREGTVADWLRPQALLTLAEAQLRTGQAGAAVLNYRKAIRSNPDDVGDSARVGLASALYLRHRPRLAHEAASEVASAVCSSRYSQVECYAIRLVVARTSRERAERDEAVEAARQLRASHADLTSSFDDVDARLGISGIARSSTVASTGGAAVGSADAS